MTTLGRTIVPLAYILGRMSVRVREVRPVARLIISHHHVIRTGTDVKQLKERRTSVHTIIQGGELGYCSTGSLVSGKDMNVVKHLAAQNIWLSWSPFD
jgi:hypothetical protein